MIVVYGELKKQENLWIFDYIKSRLMNTLKLQLIISTLDKYIERNGIDALTAVEAAEILDEAGILNDSLSRPGKPLRDILRSGYIKHAYQLSNGRWFIPHSRESFDKNVSKEKTVKVSVLQMSLGQLMDSSKFRSVKQLDSLDILDIPGIYVIKISDIKKLPQVFRKVLQERKHNILYIGISKDSLKKRLWGNELYSKGHGTFFRSLGAVLGYLPESGSLKERENKRNYKFSEHDSAEIIGWIEDNLEVNFVAHSDNLEEMERFLISQNLPLLNLDKNPAKLDELVRLRRRCEAVANGD